MTRDTTYRMVEAALENVRQSYLDAFEMTSFGDTKGLVMASVKLAVLRDVGFDVKQAIKQASEE